MVFADLDFSYEKEWIDELKKRNIPVLAVVNKTDILHNADEIAARVKPEFALSPVMVSAKTHVGAGQNQRCACVSCAGELLADSIARHLAWEK